MANTKSAQKRVRSNALKTEVNRRRRSKVRTAMRAFDEALQDALKKGDSSRVMPLFLTFQSEATRAAQKGVFPRGRVQRWISRSAVGVKQVCGAC